MLKQCPNCAEMVFVLPDGNFIAHVKAHEDQLVDCPMSNRAAAAEIELPASDRASREEVRARFRKRSSVLASRLLKSASG